MTWRGGAMAAGICAAALAWQNAVLRGEIRDRNEPGEQPAESALARADGSRVRGPAGVGSPAREDGTLPGDGQEPGDDDSSADVPPPPRRHWAVELLRPRDGEDLMAYRDRMLPIAQAVVAPQRLRVSAQRQLMTASARLDARQEQALDAAVSDASDEIVNRVWQAVANEDVWPHPRPSTGVALAADLLNSVTAADRRFRDSLRDEQRAAVDRTGFDFVDYLVFSVPWEERFGIAPMAAR